MDALTHGFQDEHFEPHARRNRVRAISLSILCYASLLLALYASSAILG